MNCGRKLAFLEREREGERERETWWEKRREGEREWNEVVDSGEVGCVCIYSSWVKCLTPEWVHYYRNTKETEMTKLPLLTASVTCRFIPEEISYFGRKTHTGPEHKNHELIQFHRLVLHHYSRFGRYEVSSVVSKVKVWNPVSAATNFMESSQCRDLKLLRYGFFRSFWRDVELDYFQT